MFIFTVKQAGKAPFQLYRYAIPSGNIKPGNISLIEWMAA